MRNQSSVWIVNEDMDLAEAIRIRLSRAGFDVRLQLDTESIVAAAVCDSPDVIVLDVEPAHYSGLGVLCLLRSAESTRRIPILALAVGRQAAIRAKLIGASDAIRRPFVPDRFLDKVCGLAEMQEHPLIGQGSPIRYDAADENTAALHSPVTREVSARNRGPRRAIAKFTSRSSFHEQT